MDKKQAIVLSDEKIDLISNAKKELKNNPQDGQTIMNQPKYSSI